MIRDEHNWRQITVEEAREITDQLVWWRPNMAMSSKEDPDKDPAYVAE